MGNTVLTRPSAPISHELTKRATGQDKELYAIQELEKLAQKRELWDADFQRSNIGLYAILGSLYGLFLNTFVEVTEKERKALKELLTQKMKERGANILEKTLVLTMFIRYVFNAPTKRALIYGNVIKSAISHGIKPEHLSDWISREGGIEEVSKKIALSTSLEAKRTELIEVKNQIRLDIDNNIICQQHALDINGLDGKYALLVVKPYLDKCYVVGSYSDVSENLFENLITLMAKQRIKKNQKELNSGDRDILKSIANFDQYQNQTGTV